MRPDTDFMRALREALGLTEDADEEGVLAACSHLSALRRELAATRTTLDAIQADCEEAHAPGASLGTREAVLTLIAERDEVGRLRGALRECQVALVKLDHLYREDICLEVAERPVWLVRPMARARRDGIVEHVLGPVAAPPGKEVHDAG